MPDVPKYEGTSDPHKHITTYTTTVKGNNLAPHEITSVLLTKFGETLTKGDLTLYSLLPEHSIDSFEMLSYSFMKSHAGARKVLEGKDGATNRSRRMEAEAFSKDVHNRYESKIRIEDDQLGFPASAKGRDREKNKEKSKDDFDIDRRSSRSQFLPYERAEGRGRGFRSADRLATDRRTDPGRNNRLLQNRETSGSQDSSYPILSEYNFNVSVMELISAIMNIKMSQFLKKMRSDPGQRDPNLWCEYHVTNGHWTGDCRHLREEVATLLKNGNLGEFISDQTTNNYGRIRDNAEPSKVGEDPPRLTINMIFWGNEINGVTISPAKTMKVSVTYNKRLYEVAEDDLNFIEKNADGLLLPHSDALNTKLLAWFNLESVTTRGDLAAHEYRGGDEDDPFRGSGRRYGLQYHSGETMVARNEGCAINISSVAEISNSRGS
uniref:Uncharacterized protein n=1 Tax=Nicotiana tabacum TaxID=4097 RepID=A0A1S3WXK0_TOBAC|nr:PREDICTED: uncharacterized protein LOC107758997 [Nicotiana tabacum]